MIRGAVRLNNANGRIHGEIDRRAYELY
jgi:hypothetical protein